MNERAKIALKDIEYIKSELEKLLKTSRAMNSYIGSPTKQSKQYRYMSGTKSSQKHNKKEGKQTVQQAKPKLQTKRKSPQVKPKTSVLAQTPNIKVFPPPISQRKQTKLQEKTPSKQTLKPENGTLPKEAFNQMLKIFQNKNKSPANSSTPKKPQRSTPQLHKPQPITEQIYQQIRLSPQKSVQNGKQSSQSSLRTSSADLPPYLQGTNKYPLRTDTSYLKRKYEYRNINPKEPNLKQKYKLLDERLNRLRTQQQTQKRPNKRTATILQREEFKEDNKRFVLSSYARFSPLKMYVKVDEQIKQVLSQSAHVWKEPRRSFEQHRANWVNKLRQP